MCMIVCDIIEALAISAGGVITGRGGRRVQLGGGVWHPVLRDSMLLPDKANAFCASSSHTLH